MKKLILILCLLILILPGCVGFSIGSATHLHQYDGKKKSQLCQDLADDIFAPEKARAYFRVKAMEYQGKGQ